MDTLVSCPGPADIGDGARLPVSCSLWSLEPAKAGEGGEASSFVGRFLRRWGSSDGSGWSVKIGASCLVCRKEKVGWSWRQWRFVCFSFTWNCACLFLCVGPWWGLWSYVPQTLLTTKAAESCSRSQEIEKVPMRAKFFLLYIYFQPQYISFLHIFVQRLLKQTPAFIGISHLLGGHTRLHHMVTNHLFSARPWNSHCGLLLIWVWMIHSYQTRRESKAFPRRKPRAPPHWRGISFGASGPSGNPSSVRPFGGALGLRLRKALLSRLVW